MSTIPSPRMFRGSSGRLPAGVRMAVVVSRWNEPITARLLEAALATFTAAGLAADAVDVAWVPGSFELSLAADRLASSRRYGAVLCLGAIIKGETSHDRHIATAAACGIEAAGRAHGIPILFGVLTCETLAQAMVRAGGEAADRYAGNKGAECASAALDMVSLLAQLPLCPEASA